MKNFTVNEKQLRAEARVALLNLEISDLIELILISVPENILTPMVTSLTVARNRAQANAKKDSTRRLYSEGANR